MGFAVLRFDARGVGESEGGWEGDPVSILDAYGDIQRGAWVPDARAAIEFMKRTIGSRHLLLGGACGDRQRLSSRVATTRTSRACSSSAPR